jgi:putative peptidoglycan lipid II flippase
MNIIPPTMMLAVSAFLSSLLGVFRDHLLAKTFGATTGAGIYNLDAYYAAFRIPDLLYLVLVTGAISAAFIPIFTQYKKEGDLKSAWAFASSMLHLMLGAVFVVALAAFIFAPQLTTLVAGGFEPEAFSLTVRLMRIMLLSPIIFTVSSVFISLQDSFKTFFYRSLAPIFYNLGIVLAILFFAQDFGVVGVTWGVILGAGLNLLIQLPALRLIKYKHVWLFGYKRADVRQAFKLMVPRVMAMSMYQISQVAYTLIASFLATGSITVLYFANNLYSLPLAIIAVSFSITSFATLSELATEKSTEPFAKEIKRVMQQVLFLVFPATAGVLLLRNEIIGAILLSGKFTAEDALLTSRVLMFMIFSLFTHSLILLLTRGFYAFHNTRTPFYATLSGAIFGILAAYFLSVPLGLGVIGIGIAMTISNIVVFKLLYVFLQKKLGRAILNFEDIFRILAATLFMAAAVYCVKLFVPYPEIMLHQFVYLILMSGFGVLAYMVAAQLLAIPEKEMILRQIRRLK